MRLQIDRFGNVALTLFVVDVFAVLETCMSEAMLLICFCFCWRGAALVDSQRSRRFSRVQAGKQDDRLERKRHHYCTGLDSLSDKMCFP